MTGRFLPDNKVALSGLEIGRTTLMLYVGGNLWSIFEVLVTHDALETAKSDPVTVPDMLTPAELPVIDGEASATVSVPSSGAIMIESDIRFENGAAKDPNSIFLIMETPQMIYVVGNQPGVTTLTLLRGDGGDETRIRIEVTPNMDGIE